MQPKKNFLRGQFTLRALFVFLTFSAICTYLARYHGYPEAIGVGICLMLLAIWFLLWRAATAKFARRAAIVAACGIFWIVAVDVSTFYSGCEHCGHHWRTCEFRILGYALWKKQYGEHQCEIKEIAEDLGAPCPHKYQRMHLVRLWGVVYYIHPRTSVMCCLAVEPWYDDEMRQRVRSLTRENPELGEEFRRRGLLNNDYTYLNMFVRQLRDGRSLDHAENTSPQ